MSKKILPVHPNMHLGSPNVLFFLSKVKVNELKKFFRKINFKRNFWIEIEMTWKLTWYHKERVDFTKYEIFTWNRLHIFYSRYIERQKKYEISTLCSVVDEVNRCLMTSFLLWKREFMPQCGKTWKNLLIKKISWNQLPVLFVMFLNKSISRK